MKAIEGFDILLTVFTHDCCFMRHNAAFVAAGSAEEVKTVNPLVLLDDKVFITAVAEVVPKKLAESMTLQLVQCGDGPVGRLSEEDIGLWLASRYMRQVLYFLSGQNPTYLIDRDDERLPVAAYVVVVAAVQPEHVETDAGTNPSNGADVQQVQFGAVAFGIITELVQQGALVDEEPLRAAVLLIIGTDTDERLAERQSDKDSVEIDTHGVFLLSESCI